MLEEKGYRDFSKAKFYEITYIDDIKKKYVGFTCLDYIEDRMELHIRDCKEGKFTKKHKLYNFMREKGCDKFQIKLIEQHICKNLTEALIYERKLQETLGSNLHTITPYLTNEERKKLKYAWNASEEGKEYQKTYQTNYRQAGKRKEYDRIYRQSEKYRKWENEYQSKRWSCKCGIMVTNGICRDHVKGEYHSHMMKVKSSIDNNRYEHIKDYKRTDKNTIICECHWEFKNIYKYYRHMSNRLHKVFINAINSLLEKKADLNNENKMEKNISLNQGSKPETHIILNHKEGPTGDNYLDWLFSKDPPEKEYDLLEDLGLR